jgi:hypothetical protein
MREIKNAYKVLVSKPRERPLGRIILKWVFEEKGCSLGGPP